MLLSSHLELRPLPLLLQFRFEFVDAFVIGICIERLLAVLRVRVLIRV
jgi:hypothetical protein